MAKKKLTDYFLYRKRFLLTGIFVFLALAALLYCAAIIPGGVTPAEQASVIHALAEKGFIQVNSPYYLLQKLSIDALGMSALSIKLPSIVLAAIAALGLFGLFRRWLAPATALFGSLIIFSATTFLSLAGTGSPAILYVLYPVILLLFGTRVAAHDRISIIFAVLLVAALAAALLTPGLIYLVVLAVIIGLLNPHVRYGFRSLRAGGIILLAIGFVSAMAPATYLVVKDQDALPQLLALPSTFAVSMITTNIHTLYAIFGKFLHPGISQNLMTPMVGLAALGLLIIGLYRIFKGAYSARSQFLLGWIFIATVIAVLNPQYVTFMYLPIAILAVFGLGQLIAIWYRTFPLNPYARFSAIVPIGILITGIVIGGTLRYVNTARYATGSAELYSHDLTLLTDYAKGQDKTAPITLAVAAESVPFYQGLNVSSLTTKLQPFVVRTPATLGDATGTIVSSQLLSDHGSPVRILTDARSNGADRFYVYR